MNKYFLQIENPCHENWDSITTTEQGKFCGSCKKTVFDFTSASDKEIIKFLEKNKGDLFCGRFEESQLGRWIETNDIKRSNPQLYKILLSMMLITGGQNLYAQEVTKPEIEVVKKRMDSIANAEILKEEIPAEECIPKNSGVYHQGNLHIGGVTTITRNNMPMLIVDDKIIGLNFLSKIKPKDIKTQTILKGAQAAALYGPEASNGVIIIVTKCSKRELRKIFSKN